MLTQKERTRIFLQYYGSPLQDIQTKEILNIGLQQYNAALFNNVSRVLLLKDIEDISDEDKKKVLSPLIIGTSLEKATVLGIFYSLEKCVDYRVIDILRELGYEVPYKGQSLFTLGIAVKQPKI